MIGSKISHYQIIDEVGRGGMGVVYRAEDTRLGRVVALKFLAEHLTAVAHARERLMQEARAVAAINHSNIATLYDVQEIDGKLFIAMEFVDGEDLGRVIGRQQLDLESVLSFATQIAQGLRRAHESGIVHRDIKPANIIVTERSELKILDFGVAKLADAAGISQTGTAVGTAAYMSPEQITGDPVDGRSDLWALGIVLFEMLTSRRPFEAAYEHALYYSILNVDPVSPSTIRPELGDRFDAILNRLLAKDLKNRFASADQVIEELGLLRAGPGLSAKPAFAAPTRAGRTSTRASSRSMATEERRQVTEMYCEIANYGDLSNNMDPEDLLDLTEEYRSLWEEQIIRFEGLVGPFTGGTMRGYFGYPVATENDARRAIRCALSIRATTAKASKAAAGERPDIRVGIHTGIAIVGQVDGVFAVQGNVGNVAARITDHVSGGTIVVSKSTYRLGTGFFDFGSLGATEVKGFSDPVATFEVLRETGARTRFDFVDVMDLSPLVGREAELALLGKRWKQAKAGEGSTVLVTGEAGIGKSRLVDSFVKQALTDENAWTINLYCSSTSNGSALHPLVEHLKQNVWSGKGPPAEDAFAGLVAFLRDAGVTDSGDILSVSELLAVPIPVDFARPHLAAAERQRRTMIALMNVLMTRSADKPGFIVLEDFHWADPSTIEWINMLVSQTPMRPLLLLVTSRPHVRPTWMGSARTGEIDLERLDAEDLVAISQHRSGKKLPKEILQQIIQKTDGVPLFTEELTKMILESGILVDEGDRYVLAGPIPEHLIPSTLRGSLVARLDRLKEEKGIAQIGAVIGREFSFDVIKAVTGEDEDFLCAALSKLVDAELIFQRGFLPDASYIFKHALIQDTAYETLLKARRREIHGRVAEVLEARNAAPEVVAQHYTEADLAPRAIPFWQTAGLNAMKHNANREAVQHLAKAAMLVPKLPKGEATDLVELSILNLLGPATNMTKGYWDPAGEKILSRATELCERVDAVEPLVMALQGLISTYLVRADYAKAFAAARRIEEAANEAGEISFDVMAHSILAAACLFTARFEEADRHAVEVERLYDHGKHGRFALLGYGSLDLSARCYQNLALQILGYDDRSLKAAVELCAESKAAQYHFDLYHGHLYLGLLLLARQDWREAQRVMDEYLPIGFEYGDPFPLTISTIVHRLSHRAPEDEETFRTGKGVMDQLKQAGYGLGYTFLLGHYAAGLIHYQDFDAAGAVLEEARVHLSRTGTEIWEAEIYRLQGDVDLHNGKPREQIEELYRKAIEVANSQSARLLELRAATSLAHLLETAGRGDEARSQLAAVYAWFDNRSGSKDLDDARAFLEAKTVS